MLPKKKTTTTNFPKLMDAFCAKAGLDPLIPDAKGRYIIELNDDDRPVFCFKSSEWTGTVYSSVITVKPDAPKDSELIIALLSGFTGLIKSRHDVLCLDKDSSEIVIFRRFSLKTATAGYIYSIIEDYVDGLCAFRKLASSGSTAGPAAMAGGKRPPRTAPLGIRV